MKNHKIAIIGCGNLGKSILNGLVNDQEYPTTNLTATKRNIDTLLSYEELGVHITSDNEEAIKRSDIIILALKPYTILSTLEKLKHHFDSNRHIIVSVATGVTIKQIETVISSNIHVVRAMPNTAADVMESVTCLSSNSTNKEGFEIISRLFNKIGSTISIEEHLMDAATVLGACGTAYVMRFMRAMIQGGIQIGFDSKTASAIVNQVVKGSAQLLIDREQHPEYEIDKVTTPKGCTIVGLNEMEHNGFSSALIKGIVTSFDKIAI